MLTIEGLGYSTILPEGVTTTDVEVRTAAAYVRNMRRAGYTDADINQQLRAANSICVAGCTFNTIEAAVVAANTIPMNVPLVPGLLYNDVETFKAQIAKKRTRTGGSDDKAIINSLMSTDKSQPASIRATGTALIDEAFRQIDSGFAPGATPPGTYAANGNTILGVVPIVEAPLEPYDTPPVVAPPVVSPPPPNPGFYQKYKVLIWLSVFAVGAVAVTYYVRKRR